MISIKQFSEIEIRVGLVIEAMDVPQSKKLIRLVVDVGEEQTRTIFTGVRLFGYTPEDFKNKKFLFVTNLEPKKMPSFAPDGVSKGKDEESQGMVLAVDADPSTGSGQGKPVFVEVPDLPVGSKVR